MEEAELLKERLQAITDKRKIQEDIAAKRLEIDREKLKLQHLKKKSMRDLWLMDGASAGNGQGTQKAQEDAQQTKLLQRNIHRIEKEIEALEREELNISTNEGLILKRLKAIEKSTEDIIKAANENFKSEPIHVYSEIQDKPKIYTPLNSRKQSTPHNQDTQNDQNKPALFAMEINVQKDLRTGESRVISTSTVSTQELQHRGIKVYDDGRKSVYALRSDAIQPGANGVDELSPTEVEELLRQATEKKKRLQERKEPPLSMNYNRSPSPNKPPQDQCSNSCLAEPYCVDVAAWPELIYCDGGGHYPEQDIHPPSHMFHHYDDGEAEYYYSNENGYEDELHQGEMRRHSHGPFYNPQDRQRGTLPVGPDLNHRPSSAYSTDSKISVLNTLPSDEPVTMIFMGYQTADEDAPDSYEGSVRAELVVIGDEEGGQSVRPHQNCNANNASQRQLQATEGPKATQMGNEKQGRRV
ncbi:palmdelphin isoform X2 [Salminus brasiliensis]|uniref:palmdelphin isoform X2 n=1 Tax=Salminus brasiliensis TaxID=930266 RepID=UPI003B831553